MPNTAEIMSFDPDHFPIAELDGRGHAVFAEWRPRRPFLRRQDGVYLILRFDDVVELSKEHRTRQIETELLLNRGIHNGEVYDFIRHTMLFSNEGDHEKRRRPLAKSFSFPLIQVLRPMIANLARELLDHLKHQDTFNFTDDYAAHIPARAIARVIGLPQGDVPHFTHLVYILARILSPSWTIDDLPEMETAAAELKTYVAEQIIERRIRPRDDLLTRFIRFSEEAGELTPDEEIFQIILLMLAGSDTTKTGLVSASAILMRDKMVWEALKRDPALIPAAIEECLRIEPPVGTFPRIALEDIDLDGYHIPKGSLLALSMMSALRDPAHYPQADLFDVSRTQARWHLVFGAGAHRCLGEALARVELQEGIAAVIETLPDIAISGDPPRMFGHGGIRRTTPMTVTSGLLRV